MLSGACAVRRGAARALCAAGAMGLGQNSAVRGRRAPEERGEGGWPRAPRVLGREAGSGKHGCAPPRPAGPPGDKMAAGRWVPHGAGPEAAGWVRTEVKSPFVASWGG